jgi:hypothetical protein
MIDLSQLADPTTMLSSVVFRTEDNTENDDGTKGPRIVIIHEHRKDGAKIHRGIRDTFEPEPASEYDVNMLLNMLRTAPDAEEMYWPCLDEDEKFSGADRCEKMLMAEPNISNIVSLTLVSQAPSSFERFKSLRALTLATTGEDLAVNLMDDDESIDHFVEKVATCSSVEHVLACVADFGDTRRQLIAKIFNTFPDVLYSQNADMVNPDAEEVYIVTKRVTFVLYIGDNDSFLL